MENLMLVFIRKGVYILYTGENKRKTIDLNVLEMSGIRLEQEINLGTKKAVHSNRRIFPSPNAQALLA